jgi:hypothetical protein
MFTLSNDQLSVTLLDPNNDRAYLGARYCAGGYIFQIADHTLGNLLSGPTYPDSFNTFDGQGIPDAFNLSPLRAVGEPSEALIIGVGVCDLNPNYTQNRVKSFDDWACDIGDAHIRMTTHQSYHDWSLNLDRVVRLNGRTVRSKITLTNTGRAPIPMRWFPHPFFPHANEALCKVNIPLGPVESEGYELGQDGWIHRKNWPWPGVGHYLPLPHAAQAPLVIQQRHPLLGIVTATCSYVPDFFPIWGNANTFSWEPFFERTVAPGQELSWWIDYDF